MAKKPAAIIDNPTAPTIAAHRAAKASFEDGNCTITFAARRHDGLAVTGHVVIPIHGLKLLGEDVNRWLAAYAAANETKPSGRA